MTYYVGQPVLSAMNPDVDAYVQEEGPDVGEPVVRGIVTAVWGGGELSVWWENCSVSYHTRESGVKPLDN